jgi:hypothetical protein
MPMKAAVLSARRGDQGSLPLVPVGGVWFEVSVWEVAMGLYSNLFIDVKVKVS